MAEALERVRRAAAGGAARWLVVALLAAIAGGLLAELASSPAAASGQSESAVPAGRSVFAVAGQITRGTYGLYLVDLDNATICVYEYVSTQRKLWLRAARTFEYDRQLDEYNTEPSPAEIRRLVGEARRLKQAGPPRTAPASP